MSANPLSHRARCVYCGAFLARYTRAGLAALGGLALAAIVLPALLLLR